MRNAEETALVLAVIFQRSDQNRARLSASTIRVVSGRRHLRGVFLALLGDALGQYGVGLLELDSGGFGLIYMKALEAAKATTAKRYLTPQELRDVRRGNLSAFDREINTQSDTDGDDG